MMKEMSLEQVIQEAVRRSNTIDDLVIGSEVLKQVGTLFQRHFPGRKAILIADENTWRVAGPQVEQSLREASVEVKTRILPGTPRLKPTTALGNELASEIADQVPVAVGSGVINDLVKYASHQVQTRYCCVATAASMDGYASAGAAMMYDGFKKTIPCTAAQVVVADSDIIREAPLEMAGWGYGDLAGKVPAGADWILADAFGLEPLDDVAWPLVQDHLRECLEKPSELQEQKPEAFSRLFIGLTATGLAMEFHNTSRPASGSDHQIAHLWEMSQHQHEGRPVSHGACVSIGCLTVLSLYDWLLQQETLPFDPEAAWAQRASLEEKQQQSHKAFPQAEIADKAMAEVKAKHPSAEELKARLLKLKTIWPELRLRLQNQLMSMTEMQEHLRQAGAPACAADIGIDPQRLRETTLTARFLRSRYTVLDLLEETGLLEEAVAQAALPY